MTASHIVDAAIAALTAAGWSREAAASSAPDDALPPELHRLGGLHAPDDAVWFLPDPQSAFDVDAFRAMSLDAALTEDDRRAIQRFWASHTPLLFAVRDGYEYLAVRADGVIVHGAEPDFEDTTVIAPTAEALLTAIADRDLDAVVGRLLR